MCVCVCDAHAHTHTHSLSLSFFLSFFLSLSLSLSFFLSFFLCVQAAHTDAPELLVVLKHRVDKLHVLLALFLFFLASLLLLHQLCLLRLQTPSSMC